jgi:hypothetical protein
MRKRKHGVGAIKLALVDFSSGLKTASGGDRGEELLLTLNTAK